MTTSEAIEFIDEVLRGFWPKWNPSDAELQLWINALEPAQYVTTKQAVNNWFIYQANPGTRPVLGRMRLLIRGVVQKHSELNEPVLLYEICKKFADNFQPRGQKFSIGQRKNLPQSTIPIEEEAEKKREEANSMYGCEHVVIEHWNNLPEYQ